MNRRVFFTMSASLAVIAASAWILATTPFVPSSVRGKRAGDLQSARYNPVADSTVTVRVAVLNGCGRPGVVTAFARGLRENGFDVVNGMGGNADSFDFSRSVVVDRRGNRSLAEQVARCLGIRTVLTQRSENPYLIEDVTVIIGRDWDTVTIPRKETSE